MSTSVGLIVITVHTPYLPSTMIYPPSYSITSPREKFNILTADKQQFCMSLLPHFIPSQ